ncbi:MAG: DUF4411 family protein [Chloroflexi bacterium]|nr:DUF4411 family protein [Chloroflexota bacterium]MBI3734095.1 DUF4411 family protein [Chloroflexota bacterium]
MASTSFSYVLDASVFMEANRRYYPFDLCPGFWECLVQYAKVKRLVSIDRVRKEILAGNDELKTWASRSVPKSFFASTSDPAVTEWFGKMMRWVKSQPQFKPEAIAEFARAADGWVIAYAKAHGLTAVTQEEYAAEAKKTVPMPNVCRAFDVPYVNTFEMLRGLGSRFTWTPPLL